MFACGCHGKEVECAREIHNLFIILVIIFAGTHIEITAFSKSVL